MVRLAGGGLFLALFLLPAGCSDDTIAVFPAPGIVEDVTLLRSAEAFTPTCLGVDGTLSPEALAFRRILDHHRAAEYFMDLLTSPRAPGRLYGLAGVYFTDPATFPDLIAPYLDSAEKVPVWAGDDLVLGEVRTIAAGIENGVIPQDLRDGACPVMLAEGTLSVYHVSVQIRTSAQITLQMQEPTPTGHRDRNLFEEPVFTADSELGTVRTATAETDPDFGPVAALLTNGQRDVVFLYLLNQGGRGQYEESVFHLDTVDFAGFLITRIDMFVTDLQFITPGNAGGTDISARATVRIWGTPDEGA
jgi:hypothetical protein